MGEVFKDTLLKENFYSSVGFDLDYCVATVLQYSSSINVFYQSLLSSELCKQLVNYSEQLASLVKLTWLQGSFQARKNKFCIQYFSLDTAQCPL